MNYTKIAILLLLILSFQTLSAQNNNADTLQNKKYTLQEVVFSVNKTEEAKRTVAQQIQVIGAKEIATLQSQSTADLVANSGNVFIQKSQAGGGSVSIRGFEANRTLLVIDGVRMNNLIYRSGHLQNIVTTDNNSLERVEILFGPSSTVYGSDALGGVVQLYTKKPILGVEDKKAFKVNFLSRFGSVNNELTNHLDVNIGGKKFASLTSLTYSLFGDVKGGANQNPFYTGSYGERPIYAERINGKDSIVANNNRYKQVQSGFTQYDLMQKFLYKQNQHLSHGLNLQFSNSSDVPRYDRLTDPAGAGLRFSEWYYGPQTRLLAAYDLNYRNAESKIQSVHLGVNYQKIIESRHTRRFGKDNLQHRNENVDVLGLNLDFQKTIKTHNFRFGVDAQYNMLKSTANEEDIVTGESTPLDTRYPDGGNYMLNTAFYASHTWQITDKLTLVDGLRAGFSSLSSSFKDSSFFHLPITYAKQNNPMYSGSLGLISTPTDDWKLSLLLSTGYRVPNVDDLAKVFESAPGAVIVPNANLAPEKTINTELGITKIFNGRTRWENSIYYTRFFDAIITDKFNYNGQDSILYDGALSRVFANQNKREAYIYGFSSNLNSQLNEHLQFTISLNYTYGRIKTDSSDAPLDHIPPFMARTSLSYTHKNFSSQFFINFNGWKRLKDYYLNGEDNEQYATPEGMPAWFTANIRVSYKLFKLVSLQAGVDNIFDTQYRTFASGINAPGRNIFAALRIGY
jgi:hemoglobin/transferrin/lactoferrin receptor protein